MDPQAVIAEARPMLTEFLRDIGLHSDDAALDLARMLEPFSDWVTQQTVEDADRFYLASRLGAFICEYLIDHHSAVRRIDNDRILMRMPVADSVAREFDPYPVALGITDGNGTLMNFIVGLTTGIDQTE